MNNMPNQRLRYALTSLLLLIILLPLMIILGSPSQLNAEIWQHLADYLLWDLLQNTVVMVVGVAGLSLFIGVPLAWWVARYQFPGRRFFAWALMLPLAIPAYVQAMALMGVYDFTGPIYALCQFLKWPTDWIPQVRSMKGLIVSMAFAFYPYVFLLAKNAFESMGQQAIEIGQSLGISPQKSVWRIALPLARPWIAGGVLLVMMECLADFGSVSVFNIDTFTTAIYKSWFSFFSLETARQLASLLILLVFLLLLLDLYVHQRKAYHHTKSRPSIRVKHAHSGLVTLACSMVFGFAFVVPFTQLLVWSGSVWAEEVSLALLALAARSAGLSFMAAVLIALFALLFSVLIQPLKRQALFAKLASLGYAMPGSILAVGVFIPIAWFDQQMVSLFQLDSHASVLKGTLVVMLWAYLVRFYGVAHTAIGNGMRRISPNHDAAARGLGLSTISRLFRVYLPMLKGSFFTAILMVFVDVMKEMPITLMTRPFGWDTLSTRIFAMTSEGMWEMAAPSAVLLIVVGLIPVILIAKQASPHHASVKET
ncbi:iron ABC transporter permease [Leeia sp. TBRC 13508]|uniref:Iron ABC transporter permease n=1 Tax=Leeia speluncae TaxID=2884804 RepID=A0ABS8D3F0_9NEIS|nr:iron ABC transporter permease [Leeia speluncae]MCB6182702.1 iron ABC transporter permease [Leeia speluncae]